MNIRFSPERQRLNIAVIGTGIAGMSAAWLLNKAHQVTVFSKDGRVGGHSHTVVPTIGGRRTPVDTGFIVYNERNYPNLTALFRHFDVPTKASDMSFAVSLGGGALEYSGTNLNGLLGQRANAVRPGFWRMLSDLARFYREAPAALSRPETEAQSLGQYLNAHGYGDAFIHNHLLPMGAAIWSTTAEEMLQYPAAAFIRFFVSHGLLTLNDRPQWRTVHGGSREYVRRLTASYADRIELSGVRTVRRLPDGVLVEDEQGRVRHFDHVVIASHADEAYALLSDADDLEQRLLADWRYTRNRTVLHSDPALMPRRRRTWASWNFVSDGTGPDRNELCVTYWMNLLQSIDPANPLFVTLNPVREPAADKIIQEFVYTHPYFDSAALSSQRDLWTLQGHRRTWYCGSYFGYGFHEDALQAGLAVAEELGGVRRPWVVAEESGRIHLRNARKVDAA